VPGPEPVAEHFKTRVSLSILTAIFPGEPGLAGFIEAKNDGSGDENWSYCAKLQSNCHYQQTNTRLIYRPDVLPVAEPTVSKH